MSDERKKNRCTRRGKRQKHVDHTQIYTFGDLDRRVGCDLDVSGAAGVRIRFPGNFSKLEME